MFPKIFAAGILACQNWPVVFVASFSHSRSASKSSWVSQMNCPGKNWSACIGPTRYGTDRLRQKLFAVASGVLVNSSFSQEPAGLVGCGIQLGGDRLLERSSA